LSKVILVLSDGLRYDTAFAGMGTLGNFMEVKLASLYKVTGELPSMSRPMYETLHPGLPVSEHGNRLKSDCALFDATQCIPFGAGGR
jgi:predicted AlkP superfamily pyrophosphatase or phosphodiesterase